MRTYMSLVHLSLFTNLDHTMNQSHHIRTSDDREAAAVATIAQQLHLKHVAR